MWAATATLVHFLLHEASMPWTHVDDGERVTQLTRVVGCAILTALNELERIGQFSGDSKFRDLGLVMALYLRWSKAAHATTLTEDGDIDFQEMIVAYANKIELDLTEQGVGDLEDVVTTFEDAELPEGKAKVERWGWTEVVRVSCAIFWPFADALSAGGILPRDSCRWMAPKTRRSAVQHHEVVERKAS